MRILFSGHLYLPHYNCGSETTIHAVLKYLQSKGHEVRVLLHGDKFKWYEYDGIEIMRFTGNLDQVKWGHVLLTQLDYTKWSINMANIIRRPIIHFVHSDKDYECLRQNNNVVYNSEWVKDKLNYNCNSMVMPPLLHKSFYELGIFKKKESEFITLINLNENKGGHLFAEIAKRMPDKKFLGVKGTYGDQKIPIYPNMTILENTLDIHSVYKQTKILLMPSEYESWGKTATEAMCYSIPVISTETQGLKENCAKAGIYIKDRNNIDEWVEAIEKLDNKKAYDSASKKSYERAVQLKPNYEQLEQFIYHAHF